MKSSELERYPAAWDEATNSENGKRLGATLRESFVAGEIAPICNSRSCFILKVAIIRSCVVQPGVRNSFYDQSQFAASFDDLE
jgi:hypothetical protein